MATQNPYSDSLLADAFRGSLSNLESLGRGFAVAPVGLLGDVNALAREYITPRLPSSVQGLLQQMPAAPTTERILSNIPRVSAPRMETAGMEQLGAAMNPRGPVDLARGAGRLAGSAVNEAMVYGRGPLAAITPQPMRVIDLNKGIYKPELTMDEMLKVKDIPTVDRVRQSIDLVGEKEFENMVNAQFKKYKPTNPETEAMLVESVTLDILGRAQRSPYPQEEAMRLAQQRAALPVEQGGLGLAADNTAEQRAAAMGAKEAIHFSRTGGDFDVLDSGKYAVAPFDAVGTHVGTKEAALDRFRNTVGTTDSIKGSSYPVQILGDRPLMNPKGMPWGEDELNAFLRKTGGHNWSDINGGKLTYQDLNANLRKKLFEEQGFSSIPYVNDVEAKGAVSYIVPPENLRSRFAAFDPFRRNAAIAAAMGVAAPNLLAQEQPQSAGLLYPLP